MESLETWRAEALKSFAISKSRIQGVWDPAHSTRMTSKIMLRSISPRMTFGILLPPPFPSGCLTSGILLPLPFHPVVLHPEFRSRMGERAFQLLRIYISGSSNSAHSESFAANFAQCCGVLLKLPIFVTDILRYFALDIWCLNPQTLLVTHLS